MAANNTAFADDVANAPLLSSAPPLTSGNPLLTVSLTPQSTSPAATLSQLSTPTDGATVASAASALAAQSAGGARSFLSGVASKAGDVVVGALNMIGVRYRWGGNTPDSGLDCSGFVRFVFQDTLGMTLPRQASEMSRLGEKVKLSDLKPGDLVFFNTARRNLFSHVGIYIGDNKFVHSPSTGSTIRVDEMDDGYWEKRFTAARRLDVAYAPSNEAVAEARQLRFNLLKNNDADTDDDSSN